MQVRIAVHATNATSGKHANTRAAGKQQRCRNRCGTNQPTLSNGKSDLAFANFFGRAKDALVFRPVDANACNTVDDSSDCWDGAGFANGCDAIGERLCICCRIFAYLCIFSQH